MNHALTRLVAASREVARIIRAEPKMSGRSAYHLRQPSDVGEIMDEFNAALAALDAAQQPEGQEAKLSHMLANIVRYVQSHAECLVDGIDDFTLGEVLLVVNEADEYLNERGNLLCTWTRRDEIMPRLLADRGGAQGGGET